MLAVYHRWWWPCYSRQRELTALRLDPFADLINAAGLVGGLVFDRDFAHPVVRSTTLSV